MKLIATALFLLCIPVLGLAGTLDCQFQPILSDASQFLDCPLGVQYPFGLDLSGRGTRSLDYGCGRLGFGSSDWSAHVMVSLSTDNAAILIQTTTAIGNGDPISAIVKTFNITDVNSLSFEVSAPFGITTESGAVLKSIQVTCSTAQ